MSADLARFAMAGLSVAAASIPLTRWSLERFPHRARGNHDNRDFDPIDAQRPGLSRFAGRART